ncbi:DNA-binding response regulator [Desulfuromonas versatilis]|uniref:DNA-binding response regulator n=1 Tax=Desulfuromonas versatilis TaxID=2802975 RepID=A0ABN6E211_9BACT|nr:response regulator transcription factor [Desulfuromonas versatilis]BCR06314.1 DNA-binding response regulator [Desulfuromonas versatilis]
MKTETLLLVSPRVEFRQTMACLLKDAAGRIFQVAPEQVMYALEKEQPQLVLLDGHAEGIAVLAACRELRASYQGLLVCVMEGSAVHLRLLALSLGADLALPSSEAGHLIAAQIKALLRRFGTRHPSTLYRFGELLIDAGRRDAYVAGRAAELSTVEFDLLWALVLRAGVVVSREELYAELNHAPYNGYDRGVDMHVSRIRRKIGDDPLRPVLLKTVRGVGYQFVGLNHDQSALQTVTSG